MHPAPDLTVPHDGTTDAKIQFVKDEVALSLCRTPHHLGQGGAVRFVFGMDRAGQDRCEIIAEMHGRPGRQDRIAQHLADRRHRAGHRQTRPEQRIRGQAKTGADRLDRRGQRVAGLRRRTDARQGHRGAGQNLIRDIGQDDADFLDGKVDAGAQAIKLWTLTSANERANAAWTQIVSDYGAASPGVTIKIENRGVDEHKAALRVAAASDQGPDIHFMWAGLCLGGGFVTTGLSPPMDGYYQYKWDDQFLGAAAGFSKAFPPSCHGVPYRFHGEALYPSKALFEQAGIAAPPATYDELKATAAKLNEAGIPAMTIGGTVNWHLMRLMDVLLAAKCGAETHDALMDMKLDWSTTACANDSFVKLHDWTANDILSPFMGIDQGQSCNLFLANKAAMMLDGDWMVGQLTEVQRQNDFAVTPFPTGTDRLYGFAEYHYISTKSAIADAAAAFLNDLGSTEVQQKYLGQFGSISVNAHVTFANVAPLVQVWMDIFAKYKTTFVNGDQAFPLDQTTG